MLLTSLIWNWIWDQSEIESGTNLKRKLKEAADASNIFESGVNLKLKLAADVSNTLESGTSMKLEPTPATEVSNIQLKISSRFNIRLVPDAISD